MDYHQFLTIVERAGGVPEDAVVRAVSATLQTLAERLSVGQARDLVVELPPELGPLLFTDGPAERFDVDEFLRRVAERTDTDIPAATRAARGVFTALARAASARQFAGVVAELPQDFLVVLPTGPEILPDEVFVERVAKRAGLDADAARSVTQAVLELLAERIAAGEVADLVSRLPVALHEPLKRGGARGGADARAMSRERFLDRLAEREGTTPNEAFVHARAVLTTLREAVDDEFFDVSAQLGPDYAPLWAHP